MNKGVKTLKKRHNTEVLGKGVGWEMKTSIMDNKYFVGGFWDIISFFSHNN